MTTEMSTCQHPKRPIMTTFPERVYALVRRVPPGRVVTYGSVAGLLGDPRKAREVGWALHACPDDVPAHRVINRLGAVSGGATLSAESRRRELEDEGVRFDRAGRCDLDRYAWEPTELDAEVLAMHGFVLHQGLGRTLENDRTLVHDVDTVDRFEGQR